MNRGLFYDNGAVYARLDHVQGFAFALAMAQVRSALLTVNCANYGMMKGQFNLFDRFGRRSPHRGSVA